MITKTIFRKIEELEEVLKKKLEVINSENNDLIAVSEKCLMVIDGAIVTMKGMIANHQFNSIGEEVHFFKNLKPLFISQYIYYSMVLDTESRKPKSVKKTLIKYFEKEQEKLKDFYKNNSEFYSYYRRNATYLDHKIFIRNSYDLKMKLSLSLYNFDRSFTTSHDHLISQFLAYENYELYLKKEISKAGDITSQTQLSPLVWSASKVSLIELVYGLYQLKCFNSGQIDLSEVVRFVEKSLSVELGNYHKTIFEIRNRKTGTTKFLDTLSESLQRHFINLDNEEI